MHRAVSALAVVFFAAHLAFLPPTLDDLDAVNFALGVRDYDVAQHQPHPPGYPIFIALAKLSTSLFAAAGVAAPDVRGLAVWSAIGGALLIGLVFGFFRRIDDRPEAALRAAMAALLVAVCPLVWFNSSRPMSDLSGLAAAWSAMSLLVSPASRSRRQLIAGACLAGLAVGFRSQMVLLTGPLLLAALISRRREAAALIAAAGAGVLAWAVPLVLVSGGPRAYLAALGGQAGDDFTGVVMLWTNPTPRVAFEAALHTFVRPWGSALLGGTIAALSAGGALVVLIRSPRLAASLALAFGPYAVFHLLFQEPLTNRYALPLVPLMAFLVAAMLAEAPRRFAGIGAAALAAFSLIYALPPAVAFGRQPSPFFALLGEMRLLQSRGAQPVIGMHRRVFTESRRARLYAGDPPGMLLPAPRDYEWLELTRAWRDGYGGETWFVADPRRRDLALIDRAHARVRAYRWPFASATYVGGTRPNDLDWHVFTDPGWFLERGWALNPEIAGITDRDGWGPHRRPSVGWVRRRTGEAVMMIGGRHLGADPPVSLTIAFDGRPVTTLRVRPGYFLEVVTIPAGALMGADRYAALSVAAEAQTGAALPPVAIEQFNLQPADAVQFGFDEGWFEPELNPATARSWRWASERAALRVHPPGKDVIVRVRGESPRRYFDAAPHVRIVAGDRVLSEAQPFADFTLEAVVPAAALAAAGGRIALTSDRAFVAGEREGTADRRRLALRIYSVEVEAAGR